MKVGAAPERLVEIATDTDCVAIQDAVKLFEACSLAINADPAIIGGEAQGRLNFEDTPSLMALIWRSRIDGDPGVCAAGGLTGERLQACESAAQEATYVARDGNVTVRVPS